MKTTWKRALLVFFSPFIVFMLVRWLLVEPYIIPSGSMIPTLLINENILVNKTAFGVRSPFSNDFLFTWSAPQRGDVIVFRYPENPEVFYVKRVIGVGGDDVSLNGDQLKINGEMIPVKAVPSPTKGDGYHYFQENAHLVRYHAFEGPDKSIHVPPHHFFVMGDNRDESSDSRFWGFVPEQNLIGKVALILFSTEYSFFQDSAGQALATIRWSRLLRVP